MDADMTDQKQTEQKQTPGGPAVDPVEEASEESFPASDPPAWTAGTAESSAGTSSDQAAAKGCAPSFLMQERGEIEGVCVDLEHDPKQEYVQPDKEKEAGGEG
jgi:hypothetical protein